jgi:hypothetical protein
MKFASKFFTEPITDAKSAVVWAICSAGQSITEFLERWAGQGMKPYIFQRI